MNRFRSRQVRLGAGLAASLALAIGLMVFAGLGASGTLTSAAAQYAPKNQSPPTVAGTARDNSGLAATRGQWQNDPTDYSFQWQRCDQNGNNCKNITGATSGTYTVKSADVGSRIRVLVTAKNKDGSASAASAPTAVVAAAQSSGGGSGGGSSGGSTAQNCSAKSPVNVKDISPPTRLLIDKWSFSPSVVTRGTQTIVARIHVADTCNRSVVGARVWATAIPYNQVSVQQADTGGDGYATLQFAVLGGFPANPGKQQIMAMLVRATDPNGSVLAGKSTRRALSLAVNSS
jgi:hypothetical protein